MRECVCAKWVGKYSVPLIVAKCVQVIPKNTVSDLAGVYILF